ncbi:hypothetical protein TrLO_g7900 [Triparma laevis f. longispina]|nr:hypothetical protein TrLO_g7900 [Triparma laevis f. longispina]
MTSITTGFTAIYAYYAYTDDEDEKEKFHDFWTWVTLPISITAMAISFSLKPRREDRPYKTLLYAQYFLYVFASTF